jgi:hypothetical protein
MAKVNGVKEKLHMPIYDAFVVGPPDARAFAARMTDPRVIRFFVDVQNKTRLETNLQAAGTLPSLNSYEARAMRVVVSGLREEDIGDLIYNSVTSLLVGEKTMVESPTYMFPSGTGVSNGGGTLPQHGEADPMATFRFAEPVFIEPQQNFRVEISFPQGVPGAVGGPAGTLGGLVDALRIWVVLDGYLTRDVQ